MPATDVTNIEEKRSQNQLQLQHSTLRQSQLLLQQQQSLQQEGRSPLEKDRLDKGINQQYRYHKFGRSQIYVRAPPSSNYRIHHHQSTSSSVFPFTSSTSSASSFLSPHLSPHPSPSPSYSLPLALSPSSSSSSSSSPISSPPSTSILRRPTLTRKLSLHSSSSASSSASRSQSKRTLIAGTISLSAVRDTPKSSSIDPASHSVGRSGFASAFARNTAASHKTKPSSTSFSRPSSAVSSTSDKANRGKASSSFLSGRNSLPPRESGEIQGLGRRSARLALFTRRSSISPLSTSLISIAFAASASHPPTLPHILPQNFLTDSSASSPSQSSSFSKISPSQDPHSHSPLSSSSISLSNHSTSQSSSQSTNGTLASSVPAAAANPAADRKHRDGAKPLPSAELARKPSLSLKAADLAADSRPASVAVSNLSSSTLSAIGLDSSSTIALADSKSTSAHPSSDHTTSSKPDAVTYSKDAKPTRKTELLRSRKMHQTSSRLLRMTEDDRPFTRDFNDLFATLTVSLPLNSHRVRVKKIDHTFTSEEAITNLGSLKFSQSNRMPDPKDSSRIVTTTTTTTFSMAKEMARSVCQRFLDARFVESIDGKVELPFASKCVWQLTPKGMNILQGFCQRNGINQKHVYDLLESPRNTMQLVILERDRETDRLTNDPGTVEVIFRRFAGQDGPNQKASSTSSDSDSLHEYASGLVGIKVAKERKIGDKIYWNTFTGKAAVDWLMDCSTVVDKRETYEIVTLFIEHGLMTPVDSASSQHPRFQPSKTSLYFVTEKGQRVAGWIASPKNAVNGDSAASRAREGSTRDSNANRMSVICQDPALRLLFREFLRDTHCEENFTFYLDVKDFLNGYEAAKRSAANPRLEVIRETLAAAYSLYNAFLAPGSPCELNIDHMLRTALAGRMTRAVGDDDAMIKSLDEVARLFDQAQTSVFKLMASDSVPKFMREPKYASVLRERNFESATNGFTSTSRS